MNHHEETKHEGPGKQAIKDPVCGMNITAESAVGKQDYSGRTFYFCSARCMEKFRSEPSKYGAA